MALTRITAQQISDSDFKQSVRVVNTTNVNLTGGAPSTVDGVSLVTQNRILVIGQSTASQNGLYTVTTVGTGSNGTWTRTYDGDTTGEITSGMIVMATEGTSYQESEWLLITNDPIVLGTTALAFIQLNATIYSGTSNVAVVNSGNVAISSAGVANVAVVSADGVYVNSNLYVSTNAVITGNLTVNGTTTTINSNTITTNDKTITVANNQSTGAGVDGAGFDAGGGTPIATWRYNNATTSWQSNIGITPESNATISLGGSSNYWGTVYITTASVTGNVIGGNITTNGLISATGNIAGSYFIGNGSQLSGLPATYGNANVVANLASLGTNPVSTTGNVTAGYFIGNASQLTGLPATYGNADVAANLAAFGSNPISTTGNITGGNANINGVVNIATSLTVADGAYGNMVTTQFASVYGTAKGANPYSIMQVRSNDGTSGMGMQAYANLNGLLYSNLGFTFQTGAAIRDKDYPTGGTPRATIDSTGLTVTGIVSASGNITGGNILTSGYVSATGNVNGNYIIGNGSQLTGTVANATYATSAGSAGTAATVTTAAQPNITSVGILSSVSVTGNVTGGNVTGTNLYGTLQTSAQLNVTSLGALSTLTVSGNASVGNLTTGGTISATGDVTGGTITGSTLSSTGNVNTVGIVGTGNISTTGNISAGNIAIIGLNSSGTATFTGAVSLTSTTFTRTATTSAWLDGSMTTATWIVGGTAQTGAITLGRSTATQILNIASGATSSGNTKTVSIGENGVGNSITNINIGTGTGNGNVTFSANTLVAIANTGSTALSVAGNITGGNISATNHTGTAVSVTGAITAGGDLNLTGNIVDGGALTVITSSNGNITLSPNGTGVIIASKDILNGQGNGVGNIGSSTTYFNTVFAKATSAQYADLAELYAADANYAPGTVLDFGGANEVTLSSVASSARVAGVVSTNPAHLMNGMIQDEMTAPVALQGRVPTSVTGSVRKGDMMVSAGNGFAQACSAPSMGTVIGKALEDFDGQSGTIEIVVGRL